MTNEKKHYVYALWEGKESNVRYIGITQQTLKKRFSHHISESTSPSSVYFNTYKARWIRKCIKDNIKIGIAVKQLCSSRNEAKEKEIMTV